MMQDELELMRAVEGVDATGNAKAVCCVLIQKRDTDLEPETISSACTMDAVLSICTTDVWAVVDLQFEEELDYDLLQMTQVCEDYVDLVKERDGSDKKQLSLVLSITPVGEYDFFLIGMDGFWSLMPVEPGGECSILWFIFLQERFGAYELSAETIEKMIAEVTEELEEDEWNGGGGYE